MNKKGFTLIELLMVIAIIAIISMILVPNVINMISINKQKSCESLKKNIINVTKNIKMVKNSVFVCDLILFEYSY